MIDLNHPLVMLGNRFPWSKIEAFLSPFFARQERAGKIISADDMFGSTLQIAGGTNVKAGRPRLSIRIMTALLLLKHTYNESDECVVKGWAQDVYFQYFIGLDYFEAKKSCDPTQIGRFRTAIGEAGLAEILARTVNTAVAFNAITPKELEAVIVESIVQEKAIHPTDSRLLELARIKLVLSAKRADIALKQNFQKEGKNYAFVPVVMPTQNNSGD